MVKTERGESKSWMKTRHGLIMMRPESFEKTTMSGTPAERIVCTEMKICPRTFRSLIIKAYSCSFEAQIFNLSAPINDSAILRWSKEQRERMWDVNVPWVYFCVSKFFHTFSPCSKQEILNLILRVSLLHLLRNLRVIHDSWQQLSESACYTSHAYNPAQHHPASAGRLLENVQSMNF